MTVIAVLLAMVALRAIAYGVLGRINARRAVHEAVYGYGVAKPTGHRRSS